MKNKFVIKAVAWISLVAFCMLMLLSLIMSSASAKKSSDIKKDIDNVKEQQIQAKTEKERLDAEITELSGKVSNLESEITDLTSQIDKKEEELKKAQEKREEQEDSYYTRVKIMVEEGPISYFDVLVNSKSFSDFLSNMEVVSAIAEYDSTILEQLKEIEEKISNLKKDLESQKGNLEGKLTECKNQQSYLDSKIAENESYTKQLEQNLAEYEKAYEKAKQEEEAAWRAAQSKTSVNTVFTGGKFGWPSTSSYTITSYYGVRIHPILKTKRGHAGLDIGASYGTNVLASNSGTVIMASYNGGYGNCVMIDHGGGYVTLYGHNSSLCVSVGQKVSRGDVIAKVGSTGLSSGPHIHFEIRINGSTVDPLQYVKN